MSCYTTFFIISKDDFRKLQEDKSMLIDAAKSAIELVSINSRSDFTALVDGMYKFDDYTEVDKSHWDRIYFNYICLRDSLKDRLKKCEAIYNRLASREELEDICDEMEEIKQNLSILESYKDKLGMVFDILEDITWRKSDYTIIVYEG